MVRTTEHNDKGRRDCMVALLALAAGCGAVLEDPAPDREEPVAWVLNAEEAAIIRALRSHDDIEAIGALADAIRAMAKRLPDFPRVPS